ncbi:HAMP domain-containing histidine kinase [Paenibacillus sp. WQ 127069]|uniref:histidine kinase n=1 Tax=Paenibacillus baimaensis TaxID=2982185 RepID=A0ABT2UQY5_9BACL|nr:HAMP domain-containing sensor histidine kinase [Paenibacillus sp. WQ 127069]MCU6796436.1 HAMP domain-containing histidine kinase [Paenibacillus sp. WQ 127069]
MPTRQPKRSTLLRYWTLRYVLTLFIGLLIIGVASVLWLQHEALTSRLDNIQSFSQQAADYVTSDNGQIVIPEQFYKWIDLNQRKYKLPGQFGLTVFNQSGSALFYKSAPLDAGPPAQEGGNPPPPPPMPNTGQPAAPSNTPNNMPGASGADPAFPSPPPLVDRVIVSNIGNQYTIVTPIYRSNSVIGSIAVSYAKIELTDISQQYGLITSLLLISGLLGWLILYLLLRKLSQPIYAVVNAFKQIQSGNYTLMLQDNVKEQEIHELLVYFNAMAARLEQLEHLRTELLAGVTHELRTPVTSIRGLLRAIQDQVVTADEADEFLDISLKETQRLERMVSDLLDFNAFASGHVRNQSEAIDLGKLLGEIVYQWSLIHQEDDLEIRFDIPNRELISRGDAGRIQQIIVNLLNNSWQAAKGHCIISVSLQEYSSAMYEVQVADNGSGIPADEQVNIYERYYRGSNKKLAVRGLGLGLTISQMLATAMDGKLILKDSSSQGTTFQLLLPRASE